jgi:hypothetical protein
MPRGRILLSLAALAVASCADKANPVLPPSGNPLPGGQQSGTTVYDGAVFDEASAGLRDVAADSISDPALACPAPCDLLKQNCGACPGFACYPVSGVARCQSAGIGGAQGQCVFPNDCAQGLTCIAVTPTSAACLKLCDVFDPTSCELGSVCQALLPFTGVGYCQSPS